MPTQVWKCDHCSDTTESFLEANEHENECSWNPENRYCYSCGNRYTNPNHHIFGEDTTCTKGLDMDHFEDVGNCKGWIKE